MGWATLAAPINRPEGSGAIPVRFSFAGSTRVALCTLVAAFGLSVPASRPAPARASFVLWAWERPEDLRFAGGAVAVAVLAGTITLSGDASIVRPRLQPLLVIPAQRLVGTVHVEIDRSYRLAWTPSQRASAAAAALAMMQDPRFGELQLDFEVRASERSVLLELLRDIRAGLGSGRPLSMTALASWCDTEDWLAAAPVDDVVPMLFRMGAGGAPLVQRLARGGDFANPRCRRSFGVAVDTTLRAVPPGRRIFIFDRAPWTPDHLAAMRRSLG